MAQFSANEAVSLEKRVNLRGDPTVTSPGDVDCVYETQRCEQWIRSNGFKKVCLQFPDHLLSDSCEVATRLQDLLGQIVYVVGDSAYESCCVDYVTAQHVEADGIIHFGPKCFSEWTGVIPCLCVYEKAEIDVGRLQNAIAKEFEGDEVSIVLDTPYIHKKEVLSDAFRRRPNVEVTPIDGVKLGDGVIRDGAVLYVGANNRKLMNFHLIFKPKDLYFYDPEESNPSIENYEENSAILKRRWYLVEKIKDSRVFGIIIGTLVVKNFIDVIDRIKQLLKCSGKTYYTISVGRPTVSKLANFPEMDIYVLICCSMSDVYDSRDFFKPVVTPHDIEVALNPNASTSDFSYDFSSLQKIKSNVDPDLLLLVKTPDVSLITGRVRARERGDDDEEEEDDDENEKKLVPKGDGTVAVNDRSGAGFLAGRTFKGLEQDLGLTRVELAREGQKGIAQHYSHEPL